MTKKFVLAAAGVTLSAGMFVWAVGGASASDPANSTTAVRASAAAPASAPAGQRVDFVRDVQPIFAQHCYECHDAGLRRGGLRLDLRDHALRGGDREKTIVPGKPEESLLIQTVRGDRPDLIMPQGGDRLTPEQIDILYRWIAQGAEWPEGVDVESRSNSHWAYIPPRRPKLPAVHNVEWVRNGIDHFVLATLEAEGLKPSPEADRHTLIRRVSLDLRGLPPTWEEIEAFVNDTRPDAYERMVDAMLADPAYGERWARLWLDMARYADSQGYEADRLRTIWRYRDWVIEAFNNDMPFDQFTIEQIAGDLLPNPTLDQLIATAFHRNTMTNSEGGTDDEEFRVAAVIDRVNTTGQIWMAMTIGCAQCHTHKYDPISLREFYQFYAFFNQTEDHDQMDDRPTIPTPTREQQAEMARLNARLAELETQIATTDLTEAQAAWEAEIAARIGDWQVLQPTSVTSAQGATLTVLDDQSVLASGTNPEKDTYTFIAEADLTNVTGIRLEALPHESLPSGGPGRVAHGNFALSEMTVSARPLTVRQPPAARYVRIELPGEGRILSLAEVQVFSGGRNIAGSGQASQSSTAFGGEARLAIDGNTAGRYDAATITHTDTETNPWWELDLREPHAIERIVLWNRNEANLHTRLNGAVVKLLDANRQLLWSNQIPQAAPTSTEVSPVGERRLVLTDATATHAQANWGPDRVIDGDESGKSGWSIAPLAGKAHTATFALASPAQMDKAQLTFTLVHNYGQNHALGRFRLSVTTMPIELLKAPEAVRVALATPAVNRTAEQREVVANYYRSITPVLEGQRREIERVRTQLASIQPPTTPIMRELPPDKQRVTRIFVGGSFLNPGEEVQPGVPSALHPMPSGAPMNRLGLAQWLVSRDNPLTARVIANRYWAHLFAAGIVETTEDFGTQSSPPTHPELLDWLAVEFMDNGWSQKKLLKTIVMSATYRQSSKVTPELLERDPRNQLLARGPRFRLEAEQIRDQALAVAGLLSRKMFGPSVMPPQPEGIWNVVYSGDKWITSPGEDRYRRALYTLIRRTTPYPSLLTFDGTSREVCVDRRIRTNTPLQAMVTLNDPVYVEAAQALARRMIREGGTNAYQRAAYGLKLVLGRPPKQAEVNRLVELYEQERQVFAQRRDDAVKMATDPLGPVPQDMDTVEAAAWTIVANVLLNLDEVLTKG